MQNSVFKFIINSLKPFKFYIFLHLFVITYAAIDISLWPYVSKLMINILAATPKENLIAEITPTAIFLIILTILPGFIWRISDYSWMKMSPLLRKKITTDNMEYLMKHSHNFFQNNFAGALTNRIKELASSTHSLLEITIYNFLKTFLAIIIAFFTLYSIHKIFAFAIILWVILFFILAIRAAKLTSKMSADLSDQSSKITGCLVDILSNISNIKFFASNKKEKKNIEDLCDEYTVFSRRRNLFLLKFFTIHGLTFGIYFAFCIITLINLYAKSLVTLGDFMMLFTINCWLINEMWNAAGQMRDYLEHLGMVKQALKIIHKPIEINDGGQEIKITKGEIIFEDVSFAYNDSAEIFKNNSITIKPGQKVGLVGHSGSGKSTFVNLILRFFDVKKGRILIDGQDICASSQESLRSQIGVIPQEPTLFHRTLLQNISYGAKENVSKKEVIEASQKANCHDFILQIPKQYEALVGERGIKLSGGQRQRIAIARAFVKNAPILILDEATSQLDSIAENLIGEALEKLMENKTVIVIAHRLSTLQHMDRILVFDNGKIVEEGSHQELLTLNGTYKKLWDAQVGGFIEK